MAVRYLVINMKRYTLRGVIRITANGWRYGVGLPCRHFHLTTTVTGKLHYTACCVSGSVKLVEC